MNMHAVAIAIAALVIIAPQGQAAESVYTVLNFDDNSCKPTGPAATKEDDEMGVASLICPGFKNYPVQYESGDERESVHYGDPAEATTNSAWESFASFNSVTDKIEWRIDGKGLPFAAIHRYRVLTQDEERTSAAEPYKGEVLVISKVGQPAGPSGCVIGLVDGLENADADDLARQVADTLASGFKCGQDKAVYHGKRGDKAADFETYFSE